MGTAQALGEILARVEHIHAMQHAMLRMQGYTQEQITQLLAAHNDAEQFEKLVGELRKPTEALAAAVKANQ